MHNNSLLLFKKHCAKLFTDNNLAILEVGPDKFPSSFQTLEGVKFGSWDTIDLYSSPNLTFQALEENNFPIKDNRYDIVLSANVIEHTRKPWLWIKELTRVCKKDGYVICINPISWPYHEAPIDCFRMYPEGMKSLFEEAGLTIENVVMENCQYNLTEFKRVVQGAEKPFKKWKLTVMKLIGYPLEYALDIVTIGIKNK